MYLVLFAVLSVLVDLLTSTVPSPEEETFINSATNRFIQMSSPELLGVWHTDCHRRCQYQLQAHVEIACRFDPYRVVHRKRRSPDSARTKSFSLSRIKVKVNISRQAPVNETGESPPANTDAEPFIAKNLAVTFLRPSRAASMNSLSKTSRRSKRNSNIMEECCFNKACAWEEYAEYCQRHPRRASERVSVCSYT